MSTVQARLVEEVRALDAEALRALGDRSGQHRPLRQIFENRESCAEHVKDERSADLAFRRVPVTVDRNGPVIPPLGVERYGPGGFADWIHMLLSKLKA